MHKNQTLVLVLALQYCAIEKLRQRLRAPFTVRTVLTKQMREDIIND